MSPRLPLLAVLLAAGARAASDKDSLLGSFVRSDRWHVTRAGGGRVEEFAGRVRYRRGTRSLLSDWARYDHKSRRLWARGSILGEERLERGETVRVWGERGTFDMESGRGELLPAPRGRVRFRRDRADGGKDAGAADRLLWDAKARTITLEGRVEADGPDGISRSDRARYDIDAQALLLEGGRPVLTAVQPGWSAASQADRILAHREPGRVEGEGSSRGWVRFKESVPGTKR